MTPVPLSLKQIDPPATDLFRTGPASRPPSHPAPSPHDGGSAPVCQPVLPETFPRGPLDGLYVHIPFCFHKCHYCDFYSITRQSPERMERFVDLLLREAERWSPHTPEWKPRTVFFGGGTPSLLPVEAMGRLIAGLRSRVDLSGVDEWTVECNPATVDRAYLDRLRAAGVDRLSFGAQSFDAQELRTLERHHHPDEVAQSLELARGAGFTRLNLDLIYAIPGQSAESWARSLDAALALGTRHLSCYALTYEANTPMAVRKRLGQVKAADESLELTLFRRTRTRLAGCGLPAYEISNFAAPGEEARHNLMYWRGGSYLGLGPSAASHLHGWRWKNRPHLGEWEQAVESGRLPAVEVECLTAQRRAGELAYLMLRLSDGIDLAHVRQTTGIDLSQTAGGIIRHLTTIGVVERASERVRLTDRGAELADAVAAEFLVIE